MKQAKKLWAWLETRINCFRRRGNTGLNKTRSRSHVLYIIQDDTITDATAPGKIFTLADFAGTEKLDFLVPKQTQEKAKSVTNPHTGEGYSWFSVALPPQGGSGVVDSTAKSKGAVPIVMDEKLAKAKVPAGVITQLAKATFIQEASSNSFFSNTSVKSKQKSDTFLKRASALMGPFAFLPSLKFFGKFVWMFWAVFSAASRNALGLPGL